MLREYSALLSPCPMSKYPGRTQNTHYGRSHVSMAQRVMCVRCLRHSAVTMCRQHYSLMKTDARLAGCCEASPTTHSPVDLFEYTTRTSLSIIGLILDVQLTEVSPVISIILQSPRALLTVTPMHNYAVNTSVSICKSALLWRTVKGELS